MYANIEVNLGSRTLETRQGTRGSHHYINATSVLTSLTTHLSHPTIPQFTFNPIPIHLHNRIMVLMFLRMFIFAILLFQLASAQCVDSELLKDSLATYSVRAISLGIPEATISCIHRKVNLEAASVAAAEGTNACFHHERFGEVIGNALHNCIKSSSPEIPSVARIFTTVRRRTAPAGCKPWCHCYCDSGCHYCCSFRGSGIPGKPWQACFRNQRCPLGLVKCNR